MNPDEKNLNDSSLNVWIEARRHVVPEDSFVEDVMNAIRSRNPGWHPASVSSRPMLPAQSLPCLLATAAAVVCAVRACSVLQVLTEPTTEYTLVVEESNQELPNDKRDVSRS
ncbi:MAG: hypothetical protein WCJ09_05690 [Planctomycetota bacterium]